MPELYFNQAILREAGKWRKNGVKQDFLDSVCDQDYTVRRGNRLPMLFFEKASYCLAGVACMPLCMKLFVVQKDRIHAKSDHLRRSKASRSLYCHCLKGVEWHWACG